MNPCLFVQSLQPASKSRVFSLSLTRSSGILFLFCFSWAASNRNYLPSSSCLKACLSFKTLLLLSCPFGDFAPKSSLLASPSPPIIERHLTFAFPTNPYPFSFLASLGTFLGRIRLFTQLRAGCWRVPENFTRAADGRDPVILNKYRHPFPVFCKQIKLFDQVLRRIHLNTNSSVANSPSRCRHAICIQRFANRTG